MAFNASNRTVLILHEGELADVRAIVAEVGAKIDERASARDITSDEPDWDLVVATPRHMRVLAAGRIGVSSTRIAVLDQDSRTLRALLRRSGVDLVVRRPVHPSALRLLLLHSLYRGPERRHKRVAVGCAVRFRAGLRRRGAILADLSMQGCRLLAPTPLNAGQRVTVYVPDGPGSSRSFAVRGTVKRSQRASGQTGVTGPAAGSYAIGVAFPSPQRAVIARLKDVVGAYQHGPAMLEESETPPVSHQGSERGSDRRSEPVSKPGSERGSEPVSRPVSGTKADSTRAAQDVAVSADVETDPGAERRAHERRAFPRRVVALGSQAARVLIGRDVSVDGMRVDPHPSLRVNDCLRLALQTGAGETPLIVSARVLRDDGANGAALQYQRLSETARDQLAKMVDTLPVLDGRSGPGQGQGLMVSEIVDSAD